MKKTTITFQGQAFEIFRSDLSPAVKKIFITSSDIRCYVMKNNDKIVVWFLNAIGTLPVVASDIAFINEVVANFDKYYKKCKQPLK